MKINVALFGLGRIGIMHAQNLKVNKKFNLKYVFDINKKLSIKAAKKLKSTYIKNPNIAFKDKNINNFKVDMFLGEISTEGELINIVVRDHEYPDGDIIEVLVNDQIVLPAILLSERAVGFKLDLKAGFNVIDFVALNQGSSGPNTAEVRVYDDIGNPVSYTHLTLPTKRIV